MHALTITFVQGLPEEQYAQLCDDFVANAASIDGLVAKAFLGGERSGGFYLFRDRRAADAYVDGPIVAQLTSDEAFGDLRIDRYDIDLDHSAGVGAGLVALAGAR